MASVTWSACGFDSIVAVTPSDSGFTQLHVTSVVIAGDSVQELRIQGFDNDLTGAASVLGVGHDGGVEEVHGQPDPSHDPFCRGGIPGGALAGSGACHRFHVSVGAGDEVRLMVALSGADTVRAVTRVPHGFDIVSSEYREGSVRLAWSVSVGAASYLVSVHDAPTCPPFEVCQAVATAITSATSVTLPIPGIPDEATVYARVRAMDPNLDAYLATGVAGGAFPTLPSMAVQGGLGVLGAMTPAEPPVVRLDFPP